MQTAEILKPYLEIALQRNDYPALELLSRYVTTGASLGPSKEVAELPASKDTVVLTPVQLSIEEEPPSDSPEIIPFDCEGEDFRDRIYQNWPDDLVKLEYRRFSGPDKQAYSYFLLYPKETLIQVVERTPGLTSSHFASYPRAVCNSFVRSLYRPYSLTNYRILRSPWEIFDIGVPLEKSEFSNTIALGLHALYGPMLSQGGPKEYEASQIIRNLLKIASGSGANPTDRASDLIRRRFQYLHMWGLSTYGLETKPWSVKTTSRGYNFAYKLVEHGLWEPLQGLAERYTRRYLQR